MVSALTAGAGAFGLVPLAAIQVALPTIIFAIGLQPVQIFDWVHFPS